MASSIEPESFFDNLKWLHCSFCAQPFSRGIQFFLLYCKTVACNNCAIKKRSSTDRKKLDCSHCNSTVGICAIREEMPAAARKLFVSPRKIDQEMCQIHSFQLRLMDISRKNVSATINRITEAGNESKHKISEFRKEIERLRAAKYREQLMHVMSERHLHELLNLSVDQLQRMDYTRIMQGSNTRRISGSRSTTVMSSLLSHDSDSRRRNHSATPIITSFLSTPSVDPSRNFPVETISQNPFGNSRDGTPGPVRHRSRPRHHEHHEHREHRIH